MQVFHTIRSLILAATAVGLALTGCQVQQTGRSAAQDVPVVTALGSEHSQPASLQRLAAAEARSTKLESVDVPAPPGVEPEVLAGGRVGLVLSRLSLDEAIKLLAGDDGAEFDESPAAMRDDPAAAQDSRDIDDAMREYALGRDDALQRRHLSAVTHFLKAIELDPGNASVLREMARSYLALGNQTKALQSYEQVLELQPDHSEALFMVSLAAADRREFDAAARLLCRKLAGGRTFDHDEAADLLAHYVLGVALGQLGYDSASIESTRYVLDRIEATPMSSMYGTRLGSLYRQRGELWRSIGDAYCRLGDYDNALDAYNRSADLPMPDPLALAPRVLYANLRLGRMYGAQLELYAALANEAPSVSARMVGLCEYMREHGGSTQELAQATLSLRSQYPDDPSLVRAAAALLDRDGATALLRRHIAEQPDDIDVIGELLGWLASSDVPAAAELTVDVVREQPQRTNAAAQQLFLAVSRPSDAVRAVRGLPESAERAVVEARLLLMMGGVGPAWQVIDDATQRWPAYGPVHWTRMEIAASLDEPALLRHVIDSWNGERDVHHRLAEARALRRAGLGDLAVRAAEQAAHLAPNDPDVLTEQAWSQLASGLGQQGGERALLSGQDAVQYAEQAIDLDPDNEQAYRVLTTVYGPGAPLANPAKLRDAARRLFDADPESRLYAQLVIEESLARRRYEQALEQALNLYETHPSDSSSLKAAVAAWRNMNRLEDAARWLERKLDDRPGDPHLLEQWVTVQLMLNRTDDALSTLEQRVAEDPLDYAALRVLESTCQAAGRIDRAFELGEQRLMSRPQGIRRSLELASLYIGTDRGPQAVAQLEQVLKQVDQATREQMIAASSLAARIGRDMDSRDGLVVALVEATSGRFDGLPLELYEPALMIIAEREGQSGVFDSFARTAVRDVAKVDGNGTQAVLQWRALAQQFVDAGHPRVAAIVTQARVLQQPGIDDESAHSVLCIVTFVAQAAGDHAEQSIELLRELRQRGRMPLWPTLSSKPTFDELLYELSQMYHLFGDEEGSATILRELIGIQPQHAMALNNLGYMLIERGEVDDRVVRMIELAHMLDPDEANILDTIGWLRYKQGRFEDPSPPAADDDVEEDDGAPAGADAGDDEQHQVKPPVAVREKRKGVRDEPDDTGRIKLIERELTEAVATSGALEFIKRATEMNARPSPEVLDHLGDVQWRLGRQEEAAKTWQRAIDLLSNSSEIRQTIETYELVQERVYWLRVVDPQAIYDRNWGVILQRAQEKLRAVDQGTPPPVAPTFAELRRDE